MTDQDSRITFLLQRSRPSLLKDYLDQVANKALLQYRTTWQWGNKKGESLYAHVLNGVFILETLRDLLSISDVEARVLFTAFTVHDINKVLEASSRSFNKLASKENVTTEIERLGLPDFFEQWSDYVEDIASLVRGHGGFTHTSGELYIARRADEYRLGRERVLALRHLMRAADIIDLSHTLVERKHKETFLGHLNAYLADSGVRGPRSRRQFQFATHYLSEQRGLLTNVLHSAVTTELEERHGLTPLLYYPEGTAYLLDKGSAPSLSAQSYHHIAQRAADSVSRMTRSKFRQFINSRPAGIKVEPKCLELGVPFAGEDGILGEIYNLVQRKNLDPQQVEGKARERARRDFEKSETDYPETAAEVSAALDGDAPLTSQSVDRLKAAELLRSYYIFLKDHFEEQLGVDPWERIYDLFDVPIARRSHYAFFNERYDRAYVVIKDLSLDEEAIYERIKEDGAALIEDSDAMQDPKIALFDAYLRRYLTFSIGYQPQFDFNDHLAQYVNSQHKQCVYCGSPFATESWMAGDVRDDITVQTFSNRLRGGPGEPKKNICAVCQTQFLLEKLNFPPVRGENLLYLHLFPYSFLTAPFIESLRSTFTQIVTTGEAVNALNMDAPTAVQQWIEEEMGPQRIFRTQTKKGTPQSYGIYVPRYSETTGNLIILPINAAGANDTERFLFALWNALVLQRHFGVKLTLSASPIPPLDKEDFGDLYVDTIPLTAQGLLPTNDFRQYRNGSGNEQGNLPALWRKTGYLYQLRRLTFTSSDNTARLVRALAAHPLTIFYEVDRLLEGKLDRQSGGLATWLYQQAFEAVTELARLQGGRFMTRLSEALQQLAGIAWRKRLRGDSLERSSLLYPYNEVMQKIAQLQSNKAVDKETLKAAAAQDIFDHLERLAKREGYGAGRERFEACKRFVDGWFGEVLEEVYGGSARRMLADEKLLRSAFLFYVRAAIPRKEKAKG